MGWQLDTATPRICQLLDAKTRPDKRTTTEGEQGQHKANQSVHSTHASAGESCRATHVRRAIAGGSFVRNQRGSDFFTDNLRGGIIAGARRDHNDYLFAGCFHHRRGSLVRKIRCTDGLHSDATGVAGDVREGCHVVLGVVEHLGPLGTRTSPALRQTGNGFRERQRYRSAAAVLCLPHLRLIDDHGGRTVDDEGVAVAGRTVARRVCEDRDEHVLSVGK